MGWSGLLKLTELGTNMTHNICDACETVAHCSKHGCLPLTQIIVAEGHHSSKGYELGNQADYKAFVAKRNQSSGPPPTYEEMLHELWYLRRRVRQLEQQLVTQTHSTVREQFERECG